MLPLAQIFPVKRKGRVSPLVYRAEESSLAAVGDLLQVARELVGVRRKEVAETLSQFHRDIPPNILQGLVKLIFNKADFGDGLVENHEELRAEIFNVSFRYWKEKAEENPPTTHTANILASANLPELLRCAEPADWLYGDVESNRILRTPPRIKPDELINEFNIAQVQGLLMQSERMSLTVEKMKRADLKMLMQHLKFFGLLFGVESQSSDHVTLTVDGASSILDGGRSYGFEIAKLFPLLLNLENAWELAAEVKLKHSPVPYSLDLDDQNPYRPVYRQTGVWKNEKMAALVKAWNQKHAELGKAVHSDRLLTLSGNRYLLPDVEIKAESGGSLFFEWQRYVGPAFWEKLMRTAKEFPKNYYYLVKTAEKNFPPSIRESPVAERLIPCLREPLLSHFKSKLG